MATHWSVLHLTPRVVTLVAAVAGVAIVVVVAVVVVVAAVVVAAGTEVDAFSAATAIFAHGPHLHLQGIVFTSASESESASESASEPRRSPRPADPTGPACAAPATGSPLSSARATRRDR